MDWTQGDPTTLSLHLRGQPTDLRTKTEGAMIIGAAGTGIQDNADDFRYVYRQLTGDGAITARIQSVVEIGPQTKAGLMIRETLAPESSFAGIFISPQNGIYAHSRLTTAGNLTSDTFNLEPNTVNMPVWFRMERVGDVMNGYIALDEAGAQWSLLPGYPQTIGMQSNITIGMAATSHNTITATEATFTHASHIGKVSEAWIVETIGDDHPGNDPTPMYLVLGDSSGRKQTFPHPDPFATTRAQWEEWTIPLSDLQIDRTRIQSMTIGVGDPSDEPTGLKGTIFLDLIQIGTPLPTSEDPNDPNEVDIQSTSTVVDDFEMYRDQEFWEMWGF